MRTAVLPDWVYVSEADLRDLEPLPKPHLSDWEIRDGAVARGPFVVELVRGAEIISSGVFYRLSFKVEGDERLITYGSDRMKIANIEGRVTRRDGIIRASLKGAENVELRIRPLRDSDVELVDLDPTPENVKQLAQRLAKDWGFQ